MAIADESTSGKLKGFTTVRGNYEDMQAVQEAGYTYAEAFRLGCRQILGKVESDVDVMKAELKELEQERVVMDTRRNFLKSKLAEHEAETNAEAQASQDQFEHIVSEFERLVFSAGSEKKTKPIKFLADMHPILSKDLVLKIYADATPEGKTSPAVENLRALLERYLM